MEAETFHLPLTWSVYLFWSYLDCQLQQGKELSDVIMSTVEWVPLIFSAFFCRPSKV